MYDKAPLRHVPAGRKFRSKKIASVSSAITASLLFAVAIAGIIVFAGAKKSAVELVEHANNNQYLVKVEPVIPGNGALTSIDSTNLTQNDIKKSVSLRMIITPN